MADSPTLSDGFISNYPQGIASVNAPPASPPPRRTKRSSQSSISFADEIPIQSSPPTINPFDFEDISGAQGLGITGRTPSISRKPVGGGTPTPRSPPAKPFFTTSAGSSPYTPASHSNPFLSPKPDQHTYSFEGRGLPPLLEDEVDLSTGKNTPSHDEFPGRISSDRSRGGGDGDTPSLRESLRESLTENKMDHDGCPSKADIHSSRKSYLSISILILSIYSTVFSGIYLIVALMQPRYGRKIRSGGKLTPETASVLFALFAKTIELSFVGVFVAFLGQVLSRRSLIKKSRGVTIAELTMRNWVIQPAFMITHFETLRHAGLTFLGLLTLTNGFVAMFYTTASDSLVSPHLKFGNWAAQEMVGNVTASYANPNYVAKLCRNPTLSMDPVFAGTTCLAVLHAGQAHSNHITFLDDWVRISAGGPVATLDRPQAPAMLYDNTTVLGSWISRQWSDMEWSYKQFNRVIDNVTMAMPHAGVFAAARHPNNHIMQPEDLAGVGEYRVKAAVISPAVNVLCVNMNETELSPLVYVTWPNANITMTEEIKGQRLPFPGHIWTDEAHPKPGKKFMNSTAVDDIFEWGTHYKYGPPTFPMFPSEYNSILNASFYGWGTTDSVYVLFKAPNTITTDYTLCKLRSVLTPACSTHYNVSGTTGGRMASNCEDPNDEMSYIRSVPDAPTAFVIDWVNVGSELVRALSLGTGISNGNAASSRLISQLITKTPTDGPATRNSSMPTIAESLAVMAGSTLLLSSTDATFYHYWELAPMLNDSIVQPFRASIQSQEYTSGFIQRWTIVFYLILLIVFVTNVFCLVYFFLRSGLVTDYSEPQNLFALAVNSPISKRLYGSCGAGPEGNQFNVDWHVMQDDGSGHFFIKEGDRDEELMRRSIRRRTNTAGSGNGNGNGAHPGMLKSVKSYSKLSSKRTSWL